MERQGRRDPDPTKPELVPRTQSMKTKTESNNKIAFNGFNDYDKQRLHTVVLYASLLHGSGVQDEDLVRDPTSGPPQAEDEDCGWPPTGPVSVGLTTGSREDRHRRGRPV